MEVHGGLLYLEYEGDGGTPGLLELLCGDAAGGVQQDEDVYAAVGDTRHAIKGHWSSMERRRHGACTVLLTSTHMHQHEHTHKRKRTLPVFIYSPLFFSLCSPFFSFFLNSGERTSMTPEKDPPMAWATELGESKANGAATHTHTYILHNFQL